MTPTSINVLQKDSMFYKYVKTRARLLNKSLANLKAGQNVWKATIDFVKSCSVLRIIDLPHWTWTLSVYFFMDIKQRDTDLHQ